MTADPTNFEGLIAAINRHDAGDVRRFIEAGAPFQSRNNLGLTPLTIASATGDLAIAQVLVEAGADVNATGPHETTALMWAARTGSVEIVSLLLEHGAQVGARDSHARTALFYAAESPPRPEVIRRLVEAGADVAARDADGKIPLDLARVKVLCLRVPFTGIELTLHIPFSHTRAVKALSVASTRTSEPGGRSPS